MKRLPLRFGSLLLSSLLLAGCAGLPTGDAPVARKNSADRFDLEARFALRSERPGAEAQSASGRLAWEHGPNSDQLRISGPTGQTLAELSLAPGQASLRTADGEVRQSADGVALLLAATGYTLPLGQLSQWLQARAVSASRRINDRAGRLQRLFDEGWQIDYEYPDENSESLPFRLTIRRDGELELRLRIEEWRHGE